MASAIRQRTNRLPASVSTATTAAATAAAALGLWSSFVNGKRTTAKIFAVQVLDRLLARSLVRHFDEAKATGLLRKLVADNRARTDFAVRTKELAQIVFCRIKRQISYIDVHYWFLILQSISILNERRSFGRNGGKPYITNCKRGLVRTRVLSVPAILKRREDFARLALYPPLSRRQTGQELTIPRWIEADGPGEKPSKHTGHGPTLTALLTHLNHLLHLMNLQQCTFQ